MTPTEREQLVALLLLVTGWNERIFLKMTDEELERIYQERVEGR